MVGVERRRVDGLLEVQPIQRRGSGRTRATTGPAGRRPACRTPGRARRRAARVPATAWYAAAGPAQRARQARREREHLRPGTQAEAKPRDDRRALQPAAARRGRHEIAESVGDIKMAGVARAQLGCSDAAARPGLTASARRAAGRGSVRARPAGCGRERSQRELRQPRRHAAGAPGRSSRRCRPRSGRLRAAAYSADSSAAIGTGGVLGSPYHASRSAKASLAASVTAWMSSARPGSASSMPSASSRPSCWRNTGPWPHGPVLQTVRPLKLSRDRRLGAGPPAGQVIARQQAAVAAAGHVHDLGAHQVRRDRLGDEPRVEGVPRPPRSGVRGRPGPLGLTQDALVDVRAQRPGW